MEKKQKAPETEFSAKGNENCKNLSEIWKQKLQTWMITLVQTLRFFISKGKYMTGGTAATQFVMQKLFTVQKEKQLHTKHGPDDF